MPSLNQSSENILIRRKDHFEISAYTGGQTENIQTECTIRIKAAFPQLDTGFYTVLMERVKDLKIPDKRLVAAVKHVIDNCEYPTPTIAQFIKFDRKVKLYTYDQYTKLEAKKFYKAVRLGDLPQPMWAHVNDIQEYKLQLWNEST